MAWLLWLYVLQKLPTGIAGLSAAYHLQQAGRGYLVEPDRRRAIEAAVAAARPGDILLIAGKGHEDYQILGRTRIHFDDREEAAEALRRRGPA